MTNQTQGHTPGPWELTGWLVCRDKGIKYAIADVMTTAALSDGEKEANGRLIAAAPDLLEACKTALEVLHISEVYATMKRQCGLDGVNIIKQAIAKAEGDHV